MSSLAYSPVEAAALLGVSAKSVYAAVRDGRLPHIRWGARRILVPAQALTEWLLERSLENVDWEAP